MLVGATSMTIVSSRGLAQTDAHDTVSSAADSVVRSVNDVDSTEYVKAFDLVSNGEPEDGRALIDSLILASKEGTPQYAEGLYWRARITSMGPSAERDYRRIIVDYSDSRRAPDALLRLGQLELGRGDRDLATQHFQRIVQDYPMSPVYAAGNYWLARAYFAGNKLERACAANAEALAKVRASDIELKNQIDFQNQQCSGIALTPPDSDSVVTAKADAKSKNAKSTKTVAKKGAKPPKGKAVASAKAGTKAASKSVLKAAPPANPDEASGDTTATDSVAEAGDVATTDAASMSAGDRDSASNDKSPSAPIRKPAAAASAAHGKTTYMVQVAAYQTRAQAEALVASLKKEGYIAHIDGKAAPFRVRIGHFTTRQQAVSFLAKLKAREIDGFVTEG
jgi:cell division septation protein DedD